MTRFNLHDVKWRLPLLELLTNGVLPKRHSIRELIDELSRLPWVTLSRREASLIPGKKDSLTAMLDNDWPQWQEHSLKLEGVFSAERLRQVSRQGKGSLDLLSQLVAGRVYNTKTISALVGSHSKSRGLLPEVTVVSDFAARIRPNKGLLISNGKGVSYSACELAELQGELLICERAIGRGTTFSGMLPRVVLAIENPAVFADIQLPEDFMALLTSGNNPVQICEIVSLLPESTPIYWFGDLDAEGILIRRSFIRRCKGRAAAAIPPFWDEYLQEYGCQAEDSWAGFDPGGEPELVATLISRKLWLEQEPLVLDPRLLGWLVSLG
jgi:hypothetical protein